MPRDPQRETRLATALPEAAHPEADVFGPIGAVLGHLYKAKGLILLSLERAAHARRPAPMLAIARDQIMDLIEGLEGGQR